MSRVKQSLLPVLIAAGAALSGTQTDLNVGNRHATIYAPDKRDKPALVISMHGIGGGAWWSLGAMDYKPYADTANFIVAYPDGANSQWDIGGNTDVDFVLAIIDSMSNRYQIDRDRVYASGFSMGGMMSWYLSCKIPDKIAAIVPGDGYLLGGMSGCSEARHVPVLQIHGTADDFVSYSGLTSSFLPSQVSRYGCPTPSVNTKPYPVDVDGRNASQLAQPSKSFKDYWGPCTANGLTSEIELISVDGMIHDWATADKANGSDDPNYKGKPFDVNGTWEAWNFMRQWSLKGKVTPLPSVPTTRDSVFNGSFDLGAQGWTFNVWGGGATGNVDNGEYKIAIDSVGTANSAIQLVQNGIFLEQGKTYQVKFDAYAAANRTLEGNVELDVDPWTSYLPAVQSFDLTTTKTTFSYTFTMTNPTDSNGRISFNAGASTESVTLDNISIKAVAAGVRKKVGALANGMRWSGGVLLLPGAESGKVQIVDSRGRSRTIDAAGGRAGTGSLPAGLYQARFLGAKSGEFQTFMALP